MSERDATLVFRLARHGSAFATRERGLRVLADLQAEMLKSRAERVVVDFDGVQIVSYSFADGFYGKLAQRASDEGAEPPVAVALSDDVRDKVEQSMADRGLALRELVASAA